MATCPTCHRPFDDAEPPGLAPEEDRRARRKRFALARWAKGLSRAEEQAAAAEGVGNPDLGAACAGWALGFVDQQVWAKRKPGHLPRFGQSGTRSTRWVWEGAEFADGTEIEPLGLAFKPLAPHLAQPGDIITVGPGGKKPAHTTIVIEVVTGARPGFWCIGFNQSGMDARGRRVAGGLALTFYPLKPEAGAYSAHCVTRVPLDAYAGPPVAFEIDADLEAQGIEAFDRLTRT